MLFYMSNIYKVSADTSEKEKAVGGIMTFSQAGWLISGIGLSGVLFIGLAQFLSPFLALVIAAPPGPGIVNTLNYGKKFAKEDELFT